MELAVLNDYLNQLLDIDNCKDYVPNGLQIEGKSEIKKIVTGVTASLALIEEARSNNADAIIVHHGYFWKNESPIIVGMKRKRIAKLIESNISLLSYHLPLDVHSELGNNAQLAKKLNIKVIDRHHAGGIEGLLFVGEFEKPMKASDFKTLVTEKLAHEPMMIGQDAAPIKTIAWCTGAAQDFIELAVLQGVDAYLTGEASERTFHIACETGIHFFAAGHHATERYGIEALGEHVADQFNIQHQFIDIPNPI